MVSRGCHSASVHVVSMAIEKDCSEVLEVIMGVNIAVMYHSATANVHALADGARAEDGEVRVRRVEELVPPAVIVPPSYTSQVPGRAPGALCGSDPPAPRPHVGSRA